MKNIICLFITVCFPLLGLSQDYKYLDWEPFTDTGEIDPDVVWADDTYIYLKTELNDIEVTFQTQLYGIRNFRNNDQDAFSDPAPFWLWTTPESPFIYNQDLTDSIGSWIFGNSLGWRHFIITFSEPVSNFFLQVADLDLGLLKFDQEFVIEKQDGYLMQSGNDLIATTNGAGGACCAFGTLLFPNEVESITFTPFDGFNSNAVYYAMGFASLNSPPVCEAQPNIVSLWPPNHKFVEITLDGATDPDGDELTYEITGVLQDEPLVSPGSGQFSPDAEITGGNSVNLRAERDGREDGRVYTILYTVTDPSGESCQGVANIGVPHDQSGNPPVDSGRLINSLGE